MVVIVCRSPRVFNNIIRVDLKCQTKEEFDNYKMVERDYDLSGRRHEIERAYVPNARHHYFSEMTRIIQLLDHWKIEIIYL